MHTENTITKPVILIVDDEQHCIDTLLSMLRRKYPDWDKIKYCHNVKEARGHIAQCEPDLLFLDVEMPYQNGFQLLKSYKEVSFDVIFTTAYEHYALKAIKFNALDYLLKPFSMKDLENSVEKFLEKRRTTPKKSNPALQSFISNMQQTSKKIALPTAQGLIFIPLETIIRCEAKDNYSKIYLTDGTAHVISKTLKEFEYLLEEMNFCRVHYSHLINLQHVKKYIQGNGGVVLMSDGSSIDVSRRRKPEFLKKSVEL